MTVLINLLSKKCRKKGSITHEFKINLWTLEHVLKSKLSKVKFKKLYKFSLNNEFENLSFLIFFCVKLIFKDFN